MVVDVAPQQQLTEVFTTNHNHHWSSSSSSSLSTHRRTSTTTQSTSSLQETITNTSNNNSTMINGYRSSSNELGRKAEQILGEPKTVLDCPRQTSIDFHAQHAPRLNITASKPSISSRNNLSNSTTITTTVHNQSTIIASQPETSSIGKPKNSITYEHLVPFILKLVAAPKYTKVTEIISRPSSNSKNVENIMESRELTRILHEESSINLSDDENEEDDDDNRNSNTVLSELTDKKIEYNSINQNNSNDNQPLLHSNENQIEPQHSGMSGNSRCQEDDDSEDDDSDNQEAVHSDAENDDNETNRDTLSLMDFIQAKEIHVEPVKFTREPSRSPSSSQRKRSISPEIKRDHVHNSEDHQNKRQKLFIKRTLLKSFMSSVNTKINLKNPSLPITIPTHMFFDQSSSEDERSQRTSKRYVNGSVKQEIPTDTTDSNSSTLTNIQPKKNKPSQNQEKLLAKQDSTFVNKNEQTSISTTNSSTETDNGKLNRTPLQATVTPIINTQPKKEKPTANVKPLLQSTSIDNLSSTNLINNGINISDGLTTTNARLSLPSTKMNYAKLKSMSKTELDALARKKKKQADYGKRTTFTEAREAMGLYLESVCYFIQCANHETNQDQRTSLLKSTLTMLNQLAQNRKSMFQQSNTNQSGSLYNLQQKFLLINYWLQSLIYHLQFRSSMSSIDRYAVQVNEYINPTKTSSTRTNNQQQTTNNDNNNNPISPLSTNSSDSSANTDQQRSLCEFSKLMLNSYHSMDYWTKAESLMKERSLKEFTEQLLKQNQNRRLTRDGTTLDYLLYIFDSIELLRLSVA